MTEWKSLPEQEPAKVGSFFLLLSILSIIIIYDIFLYGWMIGPYNMIVKG